MRTTRYTFLLLPFLLLFLAPAKPGFADVIFLDGNVPQQDKNEETIQFIDDQTGTSVTGTTNQSNTVIEFSSTTDTLEVASAGQARVSAQDGWLNNITIAVEDGTTYLDLILNPFKGKDDATTATITVITNDGTFSHNLDLGPGSNFVTMYTIGSEVIFSTTIDSADGFSDLRQPRISGIGEQNVVPEPTSLLLLGSGLGVLGLAVWRRKK